MHNEMDVNDIAMLLERYRSRPRDVVPKTPYTGSNDDLAALDGQTVEVTWYEFDSDNVSVTRHHGRYTVNRPIIQSERRTA